MRLPLPSLLFANEPETIAPGAQAGATGTAQDDDRWRENRCSIEHTERAMVRRPGPRRPCFGGCEADSVASRFAMCAVEVAPLDNHVMFQVVVDGVPMHGHGIFPYSLPTVQAP